MSKALTLSPNTSHILNTLKLLSCETWIETHKINQGRFIWAARQLVQETLQKEYKINLELDTIYRHFVKLKEHNLVEYVKIGYKDCFMIVDQIKSKMIYQKKEVDLTFTDNLKNIFDKYSKDKTINVKDEFDNFIEYYHNKNIKFNSKNFLMKKWVKWCVRIFKQIPPKITIIESNIKLNSKLSKIATKYIENEDEIPKAFEEFYLHHESKGTVATDWSKAWELWVLRWKAFKPKEPSKQSIEKAAYKWDFKKAQEISNKIKNWLEFEEGINWIEDFYLQDKPIPGIGWQEVQYPGFNKEEILLYKIDSSNGQFLLSNKSEEIIDTEVLE